MISDRQNTQVSVAIVGGGLSGMSAAWELYQAGIDSLVVLEANDRIGGRTFNQFHPKIGYLEMGGTWVGRTQTAVLDLARQLGVATKQGKVDGATIYGYQGIWTTHEDNPSESATPAQKDFAQVMAKFEQLSQNVPLDAPWNTPNAETLDSISAGEWIDRNTETIEARAWMAGSIRQGIAGDPHHVSMLFVLYFMANAGFFDLRETAEDYRLVGGSHSLTLKIAEHLADRVWLNTRVREISHGDRVRLVTKRGVIQADYAIVAMMPKDAGKIHFDPPLPAIHQQLISEWQQMSWIKFFCLYPRPLWWGKAASGHYYSMDTEAEVFDVSPDDGSYGLLIGFFDPKYSNLSEVERRRLAIQTVTDMFGIAAAAPEEYFEIDYTQQSWTSGCVAALPPGLLTQAGAALNEPVGRIYWAGTERSTRWINYMDGAVRSGQHAARQILEQLI
ncbi:amine oxidase [Chroococcidiopsis sp. CCALA 051]|uniref:flavin monoamine oxidase family protein n=1 Tax=Chroococcidiopsis sp. CCALA 051 TaxID=869949 RepID=UPI000D0D88F2|nr:FAD-dependent oxidoreductase [Chroococcidiopsis sp. CCALA 051]PSM46759.1 amine oxidase [Chroococcidiopsis sp. CCALA 051]